MQTTIDLALRAFVSATVAAGILEIYVVRMMRRYTPNQATAMILNGNAVRPARILLGQQAKGFLGTKLVGFPIFEVTCGGCAALALLRYGLTNAMVRTVVMTAFLAAITLISLRTHGNRMPNALTVVGSVVGLLTAGLPHSQIYAGPDGLTVALGRHLHDVIAVPALADAATALIASALGGAIGFATLRFLAFLSNGGIGLGVVKAIMMVGTFVGPIGVLIVALLSNVVNLIYAVPTIAREGTKGSFSFAPGLATTAILITLCPPVVWTTISEWFSRR